MSDASQQSSVTKHSVGNASLDTFRPLLLVNLRAPSLARNVRADASMSRRHISIALPYWLLTLPLALLPTVWLVKLRRERACRLGGFDVTPPQRTNASATIGATNVPPRDVENAGTDATPAAGRA